MKERVQYKYSKAALKTCVLSRHLKVSSLDVFLRYTGSAFYKAGAASPNHRSPRVVLVFRGCGASSVPLDERKLLAPGSITVTSSLRYGGEEFLTKSTAALFHWKPVKME